MEKKIIDYFNKPKVIGIIADVNEGKTNLIYHLVKELKENYDFNLVTFGLRFEIEGARIINSLEQLESMRDSLIFLDEFYTLFDLDNRKKKRQIERTFRLINHNNNILVLIGVPENFRKFISSKIDICFYKKVKLGDFINGSNVKNSLLSYEGKGMGSKMLDLKKDEVLVFDGDYRIFDVSYLQEYDSKLGNKDIFVQKKCAEKVEKNV